MFCSVCNTSQRIFALAALGAPRTGVLVAVDRVDAPLPGALPLLLAAAGLAACVGFVLVPLAGDRYLAVVGRADYTRLSLATLALLAGVAALFAGIAGVAIFAVAALVGLIPARFGARRAHLMGVLIGPLALAAW